jgi:hypothetical protein
VIESSRACSQNKGRAPGIRKAEQADNKERERQKKKPRKDEPSSDMRFGVFLEIRDLGLLLRFAELHADKERGDKRGYDENALEEIFHRSMPRSTYVFSLKEESLSTGIPPLFSIYIGIVGYKAGSCFL